MNWLWLFARALAFDFSFDFNRVEKICCLRLRFRVWVHELAKIKIIPSQSTTVIVQTFNHKIPIYDVPYRPKLSQ